MMTSWPFCFQIPEREGSNCVEIEVAQQRLDLHIYIMIYLNASVVGRRQLENIRNL